MGLRTALLAAGLLISGLQGARSEFKPLSQMPDPRGEFIRLCAPHMIARSSHPEAVCDCLHGLAVRLIPDDDMRDALLFGISETGVPTIQPDWLRVTQEREINTTLTRIAQPAMRCMFETK